MEFHKICKVDAHKLRKYWCKLSKSGTSVACGISFEQMPLLRPQISHTVVTEWTVAIALM